MPSHPAEETATGSITDQIAKESSESTASNAPIHNADTGATSGGTQSKATVQDHQAPPGPAMTENIGDPASKEELKKRAQELNQ
ncbi:hypothetical protein H2203_005924 [Taxawa tesnikishii (nom. ined.)]|nr:hypothetical protein H2203_005924 [Dothideales sp. JES 119]